jgi:hypothetical protein
MRVLTYAVLGMLTMQPLIATPALALQKIKTVYEEVSSFSSKPITAAALENAFKTCSSARGWRFTRVSSGKLIGKLSVRGKHYVEVEVEYSSKAYKISYRGSKNMRYNATDNTIHKRYNSWVTNLSDDVMFCLK